MIRGGFGVFFDSAEGREIDGASDIYPYVSRGNYPQTLGQTNPLTTDQMFPNFADLGAASPAANSFLAVSMSPEPRNPYVQQWTLGIQRALDQTHDPRSELHRKQGHPSAHAAEHRAGHPARRSLALRGVAESWATAR